jgi:hypothetical protein
MNSPVQDLIESNKLRAQEEAKKPGFEGSVARLVLALPPDAMADWLEDEVRNRKSSVEDIEQAIGAVVAGMLINVIASYNHPEVGARGLLSQIAARVGRLFTGEHKSVGAMRCVDGTEREITMDGLMAELRRK